MDAPLTPPPDEFTELVRDALLHLYDLTVLQTHPLAGQVIRPAPGTPARGRHLRQALLGALSSLHPGPGVATTSRAWRTYRLLELRYIEGLDVAAVSDQLALGRSHYHREHHRALQAIAAYLWEQRPPPAPAPREVEASTPTAPADRTPTEQEVEALLPAAAPGPLDLAATARDVCALLEPLCAQRGIRLSLAAPPAPIVMVGDRVALRQALLTVAAQVIESLQGGTVTIRLEERDRSADVTVSAPRAADSEPAAVSIDESRPFIETLRGRVSHLPIAGRPDDWGVRLSFPTGAGPRLLVVDNNPDFIRLVERYLNGQGWEVIGAADIERALRYAEQHRPRAILLDIVLPDRDGWEVLQALKREPRTRAIPVIICSVLGTPSVAIALGADAYLQKPVDAPRLVAALTPYGSAVAPVR